MSAKDETAARLSPAPRDAAVPRAAASMPAIVPAAPPPRAQAASAPRTARPPTIHIGLLEVKVTPPAPPAAPALPRSASRAPAPRAAAPAPRLSRGLGVFGLAQS